jgi:hypothetical protein
MGLLSYLGKGQRWPEAIAITLLVIGFIFSISTIGSAMMYYIVAFLSGMFFGRLWYMARNTLKFKYLMMIFFFMLGFVIGNYVRGYGHPEITIMVLLLGIIISYYLHLRRYVEAVDF